MLPRRYGSGGLLARPASLLFGSPALHASGGGLAAAAALGLRPRHSGLGLRPFPFLSARAVVCAPRGSPLARGSTVRSPFRPYGSGNPPPVSKSCTIHFVCRAPDGRHIFFVRFAHTSAVCAGGCLPPSLSPRVFFMVLCGFATCCAQVFKHKTIEKKPQEP